MNNGQGELALHAPVLDSDSLEGPTNRAKLLRAWVEINAWLLTSRNDTVRFDAPPDTSLGYSSYFFPPLATELADHHKVRTSVKIDSVRELYQTAIGAHLEQCQYSKSDRARVADPRFSAPWRSSRDLETNEGTGRRLENTRVDTFVIHSRYRCYPSHSTFLLNSG
jgi:hypothetical protein